MLAFRTSRIPIHQLLHQIRTHNTRVLHHLLRDLERPGQNILAPVQRLRKKTIPDLIIRAIRRARGHRLHGTRMPDQAGQEEGRRGFEDEAAAGKHEADFGGAVGDADVHGERHGDADADGGALEGADGGFFAAVDGEGDAAAAGRREKGKKSVYDHYVYFTEKW